MPAKHYKPDTFVYAPSDKDVQAKLIEAAASISDSLRDLASIDKATHPGIKMPPRFNPAMVGMAKRASIKWTGPVEPLIKQIAEATNYHVKVLGVAPPIPPIVSINAKNTQILDILRDAEFQSEKKARIKLYPGQRIIELRYETTD